MKESSHAGGIKQNIVSSLWSKLLLGKNKGSRRQDTSSLRKTCSDSKYDELNNNGNLVSVSTFPLTASSMCEGKEQESNYNSNLFQRSNVNGSSPLYEQQYNMDSPNQVVDRIEKQKPNSNMVMRRRSPKRKSTILMDTQDEEIESITNSTKRNRLLVFSGAIPKESASKSMDIIKPGHHQPNSQKSNVYITINDGSYFSNAKMFSKKKKNLLEYSKPIPAHFNNRVSPFPRVFIKESTTSFPTPIKETATLNNLKSTNGFCNDGHVEKSKECCTTTPSCSLYPPVTYSPFDQSSNLDTVYTCCGNNLFGQLGCGDKIKKTLAFQRRAKGPVKIIAGGNGFVLIATMNNELYSCGDNSYGQCATGPFTKKFYPTFVKAVWDRKLEIKQVACGYYHSMILTTCGKVFSCGAGCAGALGLGDFLNRNTFQRVNIIFFRDEVDHIVCGMHYSAIISKSGRLFVTGVNNAGELGLGDNVNRNLFTHVSEISLHANPSIEKISFRPSYSIIYTKNKQAFIAGKTMGNRFVQVNGFPKNVKKIVFEGMRTIILCENGILYKCNDDHVEFDPSILMPIFKFKQVNFPSRVIDIHSGIGYAVAVTEDNRFYGIGDKTWIYAVLNGKDKFEENPMLGDFTRLRVDNFHNSVACAGTFTYYYTKTTKPSSNNSLIDRIQPFDPFQDVVIRFETNKRVKTWSLSCLIPDKVINQMKKRKVESSER